MVCRTAFFVAALLVATVAAANPKNLGAFPTGVIDGGDALYGTTLGDAVRILRAFAVLPTPKASETPTLSDDLRPTGIPRLFDLTLRNERAVIVGIPFPRPLRLRSEATHATVQLRLVGTHGTALRYESPLLQPGFYTTEGYSVDSYYDRIYVPVEPAPKPALKPGQQFIAFAGIVKDPLTNRDGDSFGWHPLTLIDRTANTLRFRTAEGTTFSIPSTARTVTDVTGMLPIADDASVAAARTAYLGRTVFTTHNFIGLANNMATQNLIDSFRVSGVYRSYGFVGVVNLNGENDDPSSVVAVDPIVITFDRCPADPSGHCDVFYTLALDSWHAARILSLHPVIDPRWPARYRDAAKAETVVPGMTYDMVAAAIGWPSRPGTIAQLKQLGRWNYERNSPFQATVYFSHGRVTKYDPPGELP